MGRSYDPDDLGKYLQEAEIFQSYSNDVSSLLCDNPYTGFDNLKPAPIKDEYIYALVHVDNNVKQLNKEQPLNVQYFFSQETFDKFVDPKTGDHDATALNDALQIDPGNYPNYRDSIACFKVHPEKVKGGELILPAGKCLANTQLGSGGAHQAFAPTDVSIDLQNSGALEIMPEKSFIHTGHNTIVDPNRREIIKQAIEERYTNCIANGTPHHDTLYKYSFGFPANPTLLSGKPFEIASATKTKFLIKTKSADKNAILAQQKSIESKQSKNLINKTKKLVKAPSDIKSDPITMPYCHKSNADEKIDKTKKKDLSPISDTRSKISDTKDARLSFKGLHDLQKYLDQSEQAEQSKDKLLSNDDFCLQ